MVKPLVLALALLPVVAGPAFAEEMPRVTLTASGPDADIPIGKSFYLVSTVKEAVRSAQVFVVRKGSPRALFTDAGPECSALKTALHVDQPGKAPIDAGIYPLYQVYPKATALQNNKMLATARWDRKDARGDQEVKLLVPGDASFFVAGYRYCLFLETSKQEVTTSENEIADEIGRLVKDLDACTGAAKAGCETDQIAKYEQRLEKAASGALGARRGDDTRAREDKAKAFRSAARAAASAALDFHRAVARLGALGDPTRPPLFAINTIPAGDVNVAISAAVAQPQDRIDHLSHAAALLLAWNPGKAGILLVPHSGKRSRFVLGGLDLAKLAIAGNGKTIELQLVQRGGVKLVESDVTADQLEIRPGVTLADVVLVMNDQVVVDARKYTLPQLAKAALDGADLDKSSAGPSTLVKSAHDKLAALADAVAAFETAADSAAHDKEALDDTPNAILVHLGAVLDPARRRSARLTEWAQTFGKLRDAQSGWVGSRDQLKVTTEGLVAYEAAAPIATQIEFRDSTWVFSYVTPVLGYAQIRTEGNFALFYLAAQLHFVPNPGNDVLWSQGLSRDLGRAFALELGFSPNLTTFGPDRRFSGYSGFPPAYIGAAVHVIPYTSFSIGGVVLDRKRSTLSDEQPGATMKWYFGVNMQFNLPEYVREASNVPSSTKVTTGAP
jgi:hypothetical protein